MPIQENKGFIVFSDLKGFSQLEPGEQSKYLKMHVYIVGEIIKPYLDKALVFNTWGDAIIAVFKNGIDAAEFMLNYRLEAKNIMSVVTRKKVLPRIAGHYGKVDTFIDPLLDRTNTISEEVNTAARIEPITRAGEIFVSTEFKKAFIQQNSKEKSVKFERLGTLPLAKGHGEKELFRLISSDEKAHIIDKLFELDLLQGMPQIPQITQAEKELINTLDSKTVRLEISSIVELERKKEHTGSFSFQVAKICKKAGLYEEGLIWLEKSQQEKVSLNGIELYPFSNKKEVIKLKADLLTRLDRYKESADILYSLWRNVEEDNAQDASDILSMLAAQFKRQAITKNGLLLPKEEINVDMLEKATSLYLEAFRHNFDDYYPAINAAYLLVMSDKKSAQIGRKLARYIKDSWEFEKGSTHWLDFTLAQAELLQGNFEDAAEELKTALRTHHKNIGVFEMEATRFQIKQYLTYIDEIEDGQELLDVWEEFIRVEQEVNF